MTKVKKITPAMRFAKEHGLSMLQTDKLRQLGNRVAQAGERWSNEGDRGRGFYEQRYAKAQQEFFAYATECGFDGYELPGLYPTLSKGDNKYIDLPE